MSKNNEPLLTLRTGKVQLSLPVRKAGWLMWRIATYPIALSIAYHLYGIDGVILVAALQILNNRGQV
jgi:hypothetical protein